MKLFLLTCSLLYSVSTSACTIFVVARGGEVFAAGNEDDENKPASSKHYVKFVPANREKASLGYVAFGYKRNVFSDESAMNEAGLFYDFNALDKLDRPREGKPEGKFSAFNEMISTCRTVAEAVKYLEAVDLPFFSSAQLVLGDATGDSAIVERHVTSWRSNPLDYQIGTNFRTSTTPTDKIVCDRFKKCNSVLSQRKRVDLKSVVDALSGTAANGSSGYKTWYSVVCDLKRGRVNLYRKGDFTRKLSFSLSEELKRGARRVDMDEYMVGTSPN